MSGHSKWSTIKHKKGAADARRGKIFTKLIKEITTAARIGGGDIEANPRLRTVVLKAKAENMTKENIDRAIRRGTGQEPGVSYEEYTYEGYGPSGVAVLVETLTDNKNRTTADVRHIFSKYAGNLGESGSVGWIFSKKGYLSFDKKSVNEDEIMELALEAGAEDVTSDAEVVDVITDASAFESVKKAFEDKKVQYMVAQIDMVPQTSVKLEGRQAESMLKLIEALEDSDDVQNVHANFDISNEEMERISQL
jgi:YebC/PmpR family DNA-binding regulatory protein